MAGCGAGAGFSNERLDPRMIPGCQLFACTDTTAFPQAVVWPADPLVDGNMEAAGVAAWDLYVGTRTKETGTPHSGTQCLRVASAAPGRVMTRQVKLAIGNTYTIAGYARSDGVKTPTVTNGTITWTGNTGAGWQAFSATGVATAAELYISDMAADAGSAGYLEWDDLTVTCRNASQLTDLNGTGHHLVQATAAKQQLAVVSGTGYVVRGDGLARYFAANYAGNQPRTRYLLAKTTVQASARVMLDGLAADSGALKHKASSTTTQANAGSAFDGPAITDATWTIYRLTLNGAASSIAINGGAPTVGDAGAGNPAGLTLGAAGGGASGWTVQDSAMVADYTGAHDLATAARIERYMRRLAARLSVPVL